MDVNAPREELQKQDLDEEIFTMDDCKSVKSVSTTLTSFTQVNRQSLGLALDVCMDLILEYIWKECHDESGELDWESTKRLYHDMISVFDKVNLI